MLKRFLAPFALLFVLAACTQPGQPQTVTVQVSPAAGATNVSVDTDVSATFSVAMRESTIDGAFSLTSDDGVVEGTLAYDAAARRATFTPDEPLSYETKYTAHVAGTVRSEAGGRISASGSYSWSFTTEAEPVDDIPTVTAVTVTPAVGAVLVGGTLELTANVTATGGADQSVTWASSNNDVATVDENGVVTGVAAGPVVITATSEFNDEVSGTAEVTVSDVPAVTAVAVAPATASVVVDGSVTLTATVTSVGDVDESVEWESSDEGIATVDENGVVTGVSVGGPVTITATSVANPNASGSAEITVTPEPSVDDVTVTAPTTDLVVGDTVTLTATVDVTGDAAQTVDWESDDTAVATVDEDGVVTAVTAGEAVITATSTADDTQSDSVTITVYDVLTAEPYDDPTGDLSGYLTGSDVEITVTISGGKTPISGEVTDGALPEGFTVGANGSIEGTTTVAGTYSGTVTFTDDLGQTATSDFSFVVADPLVVNEYIGATEPVGTDYTSPTAFVASGGLAPFTYEQISVDPADPEWEDRFAPGGPWSPHAPEDETEIAPDLEINDDGILEGTLTAPGFFRFYIRTTDAIGQTDVTQVEIIATRTLEITYTPTTRTYGLGGTFSSAPTVTAVGFGATNFTYMWTRLSCSSNPCAESSGGTNGWRISATTGTVSRSTVGNYNTNRMAQYNGNRTYLVTVTETNTGETATVTLTFNQ